MSLLLLLLLFVFLGSGIGGGTLAASSLAELNGFVGAKARGGLLTLTAFSSLKEPDLVEE